MLSLRRVTWSEARVLKRGGRQRAPHHTRVCSCERVRASLCQIVPLSIFGVHALLEMRRNVKCAFILYPQSLTGVQQATS